MIVDVGDSVKFSRKGSTFRGVVVKRQVLVVNVRYEEDGKSIHTWLPVNSCERCGAEAGSREMTAAELERSPSQAEAMESADLAPRLKRQVSMAPAITEDYMLSALSVVIVGASGDLAKKKTFPALFDLFSKGLLPWHVNIIGCARSEFSDESLREKLRPFLSPKEDPQLLEQFLERIKYNRMKSYDDSEAMQAMHSMMCKMEAEHSSARANRIFYFAIPPNVFLNVAQIIKDHATSETGFTRIIVEKPFGHDFDSAHRLATSLKAIFDEDSIYRIDHYLGKEMVQNIVILRFSNVMFDKIWDRNSVSSVQITFKEDFGTQGRGGYFDNYGIIRDIMQNHLMQVMALIAMEPPEVAMGEDSSQYIRDAKVNLIKAIKPISLEDVIVGQYVSNGEEPGYLDDPTVPSGSNTPTFATVVMYIDNHRWDGVPFIMRAGKALNERKAEVRLQLKDVPGSTRVFNGTPGPRNELVMRLQPKESIYFKTNIKSPGLHTHPQQVELDLSYDQRLYADGDVYSPDAYTRLILDVLLGRQAGFVRSDELMEAWRLWDPLLAQVDAGNVPMKYYEYGTRGPPESDELVKQKGYLRNIEYSWTH